MQMVSTKGTDDDSVAPASYDGRPRLYLIDDLVEKLGLQGIPAPGAVFNLQARVIAESVTARTEEPDEVAEEGKTPDVSLCLVITDLGLEQSQMSSTQAANLLYGN